MPRERLPLTALPAWMNFNNAAFAHVKLQDIEHKGHGLVTQEKSVDIGQSPVVKVPHDLVLNAEAVDEYAKEDRNFRQLLDACGRKVSQYPQDRHGQPADIYDRAQDMTFCYSCWSSWWCLHGRASMLPH